MIAIKRVPGIIFFNFYTVLRRLTTITQQLSCYWSLADIFSFFGALVLSTMLVISPLPRRVRIVSPGFTLW